MQEMNSETMKGDKEDHNIYYIKNKRGNVEQAESIEEAIQNTGKYPYVICTQCTGLRSVWTIGATLCDALQDMTNYSYEEDLKKTIYEFLETDFIHWSIHPATIDLFNYYKSLNSEKRMFGVAQCKITATGIADIVN